MTLRVRLKRSVPLIGGLAALCLVVAAPVQATHPRPKGATPIRVPLVPAYTACAAPNRTHGPPLAFPSCNPPAQASAQATVGTADAFGGAANATSYMTLQATVGVPGPPDEGDILIDAVLNDVRCLPTGPSCGAANASGPPDYTGELRYELGFRLTDHNNAVAAGGGNDAATVQDFSIAYPPIGYPSACVQTASTSIGATCTVDTTLRAIVPAAPGPDGKRTVWELSGIQVYDGGPDGDADTTADNTLYLRPGLFIP